MAIHYLILLSRQGKVRLAKWFTTLSPREKAKIVKDVSQLVLARRTRMCNFLEYKDSKIVYRRYASLFFIAGAASEDNELITLEIIHRYVEQMDKYYGNVCELDIIFSFTKAYYILDELLLAGELQESSKKNVLRCISQQDSLEDMEVRVAHICFQFDIPAFQTNNCRCTPRAKSWADHISLTLSGRGRSYQNYVTQLQCVPIHLIAT
ncbi:clathrin adaptor complex small chain [Colletotrichum graminicola]|nr:clathrin adaptor complex small chain [Colletotrichum graminicola]